MDFDTVWTFYPRNFRVALEIAPEDMDPAEAFDDSADIAAVRRGDVAWFVARVAVYGPNDEELAADVLGACAYNSVKEFYQEHCRADPLFRNCAAMRKVRGHCAHMSKPFPALVRNAIAEARKALRDRQAKLCGLRLREMKPAL